LGKTGTPSDAFILTFSFIFDRNGSFFLKNAAVQTHEDPQTVKSTAQYALRRSL
jgi:hypothetical protein